MFLERAIARRPDGPKTPSRSPTCPASARCGLSATGWGKIEHLVETLIVYELPLAEPASGGMLRVERFGALALLLLLLGAALVPLLTTSAEAIVDTPCGSCIGLGAQLPTSWAPTWSQPLFLRFRCLPGGTHVAGHRPLLDFFNPRFLFTMPSPAPLRPSVALPVTISKGCSVHVAGLPTTTRRDSRSQTRRSNQKVESAYTVSPAPAEPGCWVTLAVSDPACWLATLPHGVRAQATFKARQSLSPRTVRDAVEFILPAAAHVNALAAVRDQPGVLRVWATSPSPDSILAFVDSQGCRACHIADSTGVVILKSYGDAESGLRWHIWSPSGTAVRLLMEQLTAAGCTAQLRGRRRSAASDAITPRQREVLLAALEGGYFEEPRRATQSQLARRLEISRVAVLRLLRRAERSLLLTR